MATAKQRPNGTWGIQIKVGGVRDSASFATKREAELWAARRKLELTAQAKGMAGEIKTLRDAMRRFAEEVAPTHKGGHWESVRLAAMEQQLPVTLPLNKLTPAHFDAWKQERLRHVAPSTVTREMNLLSSVLSYARRDWQWMDGSPLADVRRPKEPKHRERVITWSETKIMLRQLGYRPGVRPVSLTQMVAYVFLIALRTGMRSSEITGLRWEHVHDRWVSLPDTKNDEARDVPISAKTRRLFDRLRGVDEEQVVLVSANTRDTLFRRARDQAGLEGFRFHDARHTAATRVGRTVGQPGKLSFPEFCKVFGWRDPKHALIYVNPTAAQLADKL